MNWVFTVFASMMIAPLVGLVALHYGVTLAVVIPVVVLGVLADIAYTIAT